MKTWLPVLAVAAFLLQPPQAGAQEATCLGYANVPISGEDAHGLFAPEGICAIGSDVYVADTGGNRIQKWNPGPHLDYESAWGTTGTAEGQFNRPTDVIQDPNGNVYVVDSGNARIQVFNSDGTFLRAWGKQGTGDGQFFEPNSVAVDDSYVYVTDSGNFRVEKFTPEGGFVTAWGSEGTGDGQFTFPSGIALFGGKVFVTDRVQDRIQVFTPEGQFLKSIGSPGSGSGEFIAPAGISPSYGDNTLLVCDTGNNRLVSISPDGDVMCTVSGRSAFDAVGPVGWTSFGVSRDASEIFVYVIPDPVETTTWGSVKARFGH